MQKKKDRWNQTPLDEARRNLHFTIVEVLKEYTPEEIISDNIITTKDLIISIPKGAGLLKRTRSKYINTNKISKQIAKEVAFVISNNETKNKKEGIKMFSNDVNPNDILEI